MEGADTQTTNLDEEIEALAASFVDLDTNNEHIGI